MSKERERLEGGVIISARHAVPAPAVNYIIEPSTNTKCLFFVLHSQHHSLLKTQNGLDKWGLTKCSTDPPSML